MPGILNFLLIKQSRKVGKYVRGTNYLFLISSIIFIGSILFSALGITDVVRRTNPPLWYSLSMAFLYLIFGIFIAVVTWNIITSIYHCENEEEITELIKKHKLQDQSKKRFWKRYYVLNKNKRKLWIKSYIPLTLSILFNISTTLVLIFYGWI
ncbi:MAG: hypothetical protein ACTSQE_13485 [Candidatus Heimdallarchaeaceae archaeon]